MQRKKIIILFLTTLFLVGLYFFIANKKNNPIIKQIENFSLYQEITSPAERSFDKTCPNEEFNEFLKLTEGGSMKGLILPGGIKAIITPNYYHWSNEKFLSFLTVQPEAFCNAGIIGPRHAYKDYLLWAGGCSTGRMPEPEDPGYAEFMKCTETEESINNYFK